MDFNKYEIAIESGTLKAFKESGENQKIKDQQQHEVKLKEMEIQSQKELVFNIGIIIASIIIIITIIYSYTIYKKKKVKGRDKAKNSIKDKMEIINSLFEEGVITKEEFDIQKDKLKNKFNIE